MIPTVLALILKNQSYGMLTPIKGKSRLCRATEREKNTNEQEIEDCIFSVNNTTQLQKAQTAQ